MNYTLIHAGANSPYWYVLWSDEQGQHKASTKTTDKRVADSRAQSVIQKWYKRRGQSTTPDPEPQTTPSPPPPVSKHFSGIMRLSEMVESHIDIRPELEDSSKRKLRNAATSFIIHAGVDPRLVEITDKMIGKWKSNFLDAVQVRENMERRPHTSWGLYVAYTDLRGMCEHLVEEEVLDRNPFKKSLKPARPQQDAAGRAWTSDEVEKILDAAVLHSQQRDANTVANYCRSVMPLLIRLGVAVGARTKELVELRWTDFTDSEIHFRNTKTHQDRSFEINDEIREIRNELVEHYLRVWGRELSEMTWVFEGKLGEHLSENVVQDHLRRIAKSAGLRGAYGAKRFSMYETRHTTAVEMLKSGIEDTVVANVLGHRDASMIRKVYGKYTTKKIPSVKRRK